MTFGDDWSGRALNHEALWSF